MFCRVPDLVHIDAEVLVYQEMPHGNYILLGNCRVSFLICRGYPVCRFPYDLDMVQCPYDKQFGPGKIVPGIRKFFPDLFCGFLDIPETVEVGSHKGTASCSTVRRNIDIPAEEFPEFPLERGMGEK